MSPNKENGYSGRNWVMIEFCRAENSLSNDNKYVRIRQILTMLQTSEPTIVKAHRNREMAKYLLLINIQGENNN